VAFYYYPSLNFFNSLHYVFLTTYIYHRTVFCGASSPLCVG